MFIFPDLLRSSITNLLPLNCEREQNSFIVGFFALFLWDSSTRAMHSLNISMEKNKITHCFHILVYQSVSLLPFLKTILKNQFRKSPPKY